MSRYCVSATFPNGKEMYGYFECNDMVKALEMFRGHITAKGFFVMNATRLEIVLI